MQIQVKGKIKQIGKREYAANGRKVYPGKIMYKRALLIETDDENDVCIYLPSLHKKEDYSQLIEELGLEVGDNVSCGVTISSRPWKYTFITNIHCTEITKI